MALILTLAVVASNPRAVHGNSAVDNANGHQMLKRADNRVNPRSVIIKRIPSAPPRPRDIIIERWVPYGAQVDRPRRARPADAIGVAQN